MLNPISSLNPYINEWRIKVRVTAKSSLNSNVNGKHFDVHLMDASGEIRAVAFRQQAEQFYDIIKVDHVYYISKCKIQGANPDYARLKNSHEIILTEEAQIEPCKDDDSDDIPEIKYNLLPISDVIKLKLNSSVDTIGICKEVGKLQTKISNSQNNEFKIRELILVDSSNTAISLKLFGDDAIKFDAHEQPVVILVKRACLTEYNGIKSLKLAYGSVMKLNPDIPEGSKLRLWFDNKHDTEYQQVKRRKDNSHIAAHFSDDESFDLTQECEQELETVNEQDISIEYSSTDVTKQQLPRLNELPSTSAAAVSAPASATTPTPTPTATAITSTPNTSITNNYQCADQQFLKDVLCIMEKMNDRQKTEFKYEVYKNLDKYNNNQ